MPPSSRPIHFHPASGLAVAVIAAFATVGHGQQIPPAPPLPLSPAPAAATAPKPADPAASLPAEFRPQTESPRFNSNIPPFVRDPDELTRLRAQLPAWLQQSLKFPGEGEITRFLGRDSGGAREKAAADLREMLNPRLSPEGLEARLVPMARWAILYEDWRRGGGIDVFLCKFEGPADVVIQVLETPNHVVAIYRDLKAKRVNDLAAIRGRAREHADALFSAPYTPKDADAMRVFRTGVSPDYVFGWYIPSLLELTGTAGPAPASPEAARAEAPGMRDEATTVAPPAAVRYFSSGEFTAFFALKSSRRSGELANPFDPRFEPVGESVVGLEKPFWMKGSLGAAPGQGAAAGASAALPMDTESVQRRQAEDYLGSAMVDPEGRKVLESIVFTDLDDAFRGLSPEQQMAVVERKMIDDFRVAGMRAFAAQDYREALVNWTRLLNLDPSDPRAAILLKLAVKRRIASPALGDDPRKVAADDPISDARKAMDRQSAVLRRRQGDRDVAQVRDRALADLRSRALGFLSEGNYEASLREWDRFLIQDPGNPIGLFYQDVCRLRLKQDDEARLSRSTGSGGPGGKPAPKPTKGPSSKVSK